MRGQSEQAEERAEGDDERGRTGAKMLKTKRAFWANKVLCWRKKGVCVRAAQTGITKKERRERKRGRGQREISQKSNRRKTKFRAKKVRNVFVREGRTRNGKEG